MTEGLKRKLFLFHTAFPGFARKAPEYVVQDYDKFIHFLSLSAVILP
ncbi:uncharacterized protein G2W53_009156 [Senna tora]|uniref:Uncharacterized protein n=1 Tax=Senna tora TaxID=362788 RepID=A0A834WY10_9FABA|nr:uncharacterized protein G2W53_009156 [Senna tora]